MGNYFKKQNQPKIQAYKKTEQKQQTSQNSQKIEQLQLKKQFNNDQCKVAQNILGQSNYQNKPNAKNDNMHTNNQLNNKMKNKLLPEDTRQSNQIDETKIGTPHIENIFWQMLRNGKTKSLTKAFKQQLVNCNSVIVPTSGHTIVHQSVILDKRQYFKLCEIYGADWDIQDLNGVTALMKAVALNRTFYVQRLLSLGAQKNLKDKRGMTAQDYGKFYQSYDSLDLLQQSI